MVKMIKNIKFFNDIDYSSKTHKHQKKETYIGKIYLAKSLISSFNLICTFFTTKLYEKKLKVASLLSNSISINTTAISRIVIQFFIVLIPIRSCDNSENATESQPTIVLAKTYNKSINTLNEYRFGKFKEGDMSYVVTLCFRKTPQSIEETVNAQNIVKKLKHKNILIPLNDWIPSRLESGRRYFAQIYGAEGNTPSHGLFYTYNLRAFSVHHFIKIFRNILLTLRYLHSNNVVMIGLSPGDILIKTAKRNIVAVCLSTFYEAQEFSDPNEIKVIDGFVKNGNHYAPEVCAGNIVSTKVDVFSFGYIMDFFEVDFNNAIDIKNNNPVIIDFYEDLMRLCKDENHLTRVSIDKALKHKFFSPSLPQILPFRTVENFKCVEDKEYEVIKFDDTITIIEGDESITIIQAENNTVEFRIKEEKIEQWFLEDNYIEMIYIGMKAVKKKNKKAQIRKLITLRR